MPPHGPGPDESGHTNDQRRERVPFRLTSPGDLIAVIPYLLGFYPAHSLVLVTIRDGAIDMTKRYELPPSSQDRQAAWEIAAALVRSVESRVIGIVIDTSPAHDAGPRRTRLVDTSSVNTRSTIYTTTITKCGWNTNCSRNVTPHDRPPAVHHARSPQLNARV
jgi:hypothetical protein